MSDPELGNVNRDPLTSARWIVFHAGMALAEASEVLSHPSETLRILERDLGKAVDSYVDLGGRREDAFKLPVLDI